MGKNMAYTKCCSEKPMGNNDFGDLRVNGTITLKCILHREWMGELG
jgi:hypothetical protein